MREFSGSESQSEGKSSSAEVSLVAERLQREIDSLDAVGFKTQAWKTHGESNSIALAPLDVNWLITQPKLPYLVQLVPPYLLYRSLQQHGLEDSLEVIDYIRGEALVRLLDYDLWVNSDGDAGVLSPSEDLSADRFLQWIRLWNEISPDFAAERVLELDEEVITGCLSALCEIVPVGLNRQQEELTDDYWMTPDNKFGIKLKTSGTTDFEIFHQFVHSLYSKNIRLAQSLLAHSAMLIREETVEEARRWRLGRLEDQGFMPVDEAREMLTPKSHKQISELVQRAMTREMEKVTPTTTGEFSHPTHTTFVDEDACDQIREHIRTLDGEDLRTEIESVLGGAEILRLVGNATPQTEILIQDEDVIDAFVQKVVGETNQLLLSLEFHKAREVNARKAADSDLLIDRVMHQLLSDFPQLALEWKTRLARTTNGVAAAFGATTESSDLERVLSAVRGCLNVALEKLVKNPESAGISAEFLSENSEAAIRALNIAKILGPEVLFQVGWQTLQDLSMDALQNLVLFVGRDELLNKKIALNYAVRLSDGETIHLSVFQLLSRGRYLEVRNWLRGFSGLLDPAIERVLLATVNRLPVFPMILLEADGATRGSAAVKPFETIEELEKTRSFFANLGVISLTMSRRD
ncbi:hypothetical protein EBU99_01285 [bacterium]|nr:hypothetical protein [bacterium]